MLPSGSWTRSSLRAVAAVWAVACASLVIACAGADGLDDLPEDVVRREDAAGPAPSPPVFSQGASGGSPGEPDPVTPEEIDEYPNKSSTAFQIFVDPPRSVSVYCGDGVYDPAREECDDGPGSALDVCTPNCQTRDRLVVPLAENSSSKARYLGYGRHPLSLGITTDDEGRRGVGALVWTEAPEAGTAPGQTGSAPRVVAQLLDGHGNPEQRLVVADAAEDALVGGRPVLAANAVSAALPDGSVVVAYNDLNGDGSELGVGLRRLTQGPTTWSVGPLGFANDTFIGAQQDPDMVWTGSELVVAWVDTSDPATAPDIRLRTYSDGLGSLTGEIALAATAAPEGGVALTPWARTNGSLVEHSYAAVWRESQVGGKERLFVWHDGVALPLPPQMPGDALDRPAIAPLDQDHVAVAYSVGTDPEATGVASVSRVRVAVMDVTNGQVVVEQMLTPLAAPAAGHPERAQRQPALVAVVNPGNGALPTGQVFAAFRTEGPLGDANGEDLWIKRLDWNAEALSLTQVEVPLARNWEPTSDHEPQDQRTPVLASLPVPGGGALGIAWEDYGQTFGTAQGRPDIALQVAPVPLRRGAPVEKTCSAGSCAWGEGPCTSSAGCASGLTCLADRGPWYGYGPDTDVCAPATCTDGVQNAGETGIDCGGQCGTCFSCPGEEYWGTAHYCSAVCGCGKVDGDCDTSLECDDGLVCQENTGSLVGLPEPIDLCMVERCFDDIKNGDEERVDCGGADCPACDNGSSTFCVEATCQEGQGDCSAAGAGCAAGLSCLAQGAIYGLSSDADVCVPSACSTRGTPNVASFCTSGCRCPDGVGFCTADNQCLTGRCEPDQGLYFGLNAAAGVCMPDRCFNGVQDVGEVQVDCGGVCGTECPPCLTDSVLRSFENVNDWGTPTWNAGAVNHPATIAATATATQGDASLSLTHCNFLEIHSIPFSGAEFTVVGDKILVDVRFNIGGTGLAWDWLGDFALDVYSPTLGRRPLIGWRPVERANAGQWLTLQADVTEDIRRAFLDADEQLSFRLRVNRSCSATGWETGAVLVDHLRFGGNVAFRSECTGGGVPTPPGGGSSGSGTVAPPILSLDSSALWTSAQTLTTATSDKIQGTASLEFASGYAQVTSSVFPAADIGLAERLLIDFKLPAAATGQSLGGNLDVHLACPSAGLAEQYIGTVVLWDKPTAAWLTGALAVPHNVQVALATTATDCRIKVTTNTWNHAAASVVRLDHIRFEAANHCATYTQSNTTPFSLGMPVTPDGSATRPWPLCTAAQVQTVMNTSSLWQHHFALHANINLAGITGTIGNATTNFRGTFDGNGYTLYGFSRGGTDDVGLFGVISGDGNLDGSLDGFVRDVTLSGFTISGSSRIGALAGSFTGRVQGVTLLGGQVTATGNDAGGLIGLSTATVQGCFSDATVTQTSAGARIGGLAGRCENAVYDTISTGTVNSGTSGTGRAGGLCGRLIGTLQRTASTSTTTSRGSYVGGLAGESTGNIYESRAFGPVSQAGGSPGTGGLVGIHTVGTVHSSRAAGKIVSNGMNVGGLIGEAGGVLNDSYAVGGAQGTTNVGGLVGRVNGLTLARSYSRGLVTGTTAAGRLLGAVISGTPTSCLTSSTANASLPNVGSGSATGITAVTDAALALQATYSGWDFTTVWRMNSFGAELR